MCYREGISPCFLEDRSSILLAVEGRKMGDESADQGGRRSERQSGLIADACSRFEAVWQTGQQPRIEDFLPAQSPDKSGATLRNLLVQLVGIDLECRWKTAGVPSQQETVARQPAGIDAQAACPDVSESSLSLPPRPRLADYVARYPLLGPVEQLPCDLILCEYYARRRYGDRPTPAEYLDAFGAIHPDLAKQLQAIDDGMVAADRNAASGQPEKHGPTGTALFDEAPLPKQPERIGRYRVERLLGQGGFGLSIWPTTSSCTGPSPSRCRIPRSFFARKTPSRT